MNMSELRADAKARPVFVSRPDIPEVLIVGLLIAAIGWAVYNWVQRRASGKMRRR